MASRARIGIILRCDDLLKSYGFTRTVVDTKFGPVDRIYLGEIDSVSVAVMYGRFKGIRLPSRDIDYVQNQAAFSELGVHSIIGTFIVGAISSEHSAGEIFIPHDFVGLGGYPHNLRVGMPFKNVEMYEPFCPRLRELLAHGAADCSIQVKTNAIYAAFTGYPRIETRAELEFYEKMGWDIVGQTLDPEATLARQAHCHYAALCALTDEVSFRARYASAPEEVREEIDRFKISGRQQMEKIILHAIKRMSHAEDLNCTCTYESVSKQNFFDFKPGFE